MREEEGIKFWERFGFGKDLDHILDTKKSQIFRNAPCVEYFLYIKEFMTYKCSFSTILSEWNEPKMKLETFNTDFSTNFENDFLNVYVFVRNKICLKCRIFCVSIICRF